MPMMLALLQAHNEEQSQLSAKVEQREQEADKRHRQADERHTKAMKAAKQREDELCRQIATMKATAEKLGGTAIETIIVQALWGQPFSKEIDETPIPANFREVVIEPFDRT
ncbi:hypothetical protein CR513_17689, partial [Mucuna pruriens]